jgi:hypothetical protein
MRVIKDYKDGLNNTIVPLIEPVYELPPNLINKTELTHNNDDFLLVNESVVNEPIVNEPIVSFESNATIEEPIEILKEKVIEGLNNQEEVKPLNKKKGHKIIT